MRLRQLDIINCFPPLLETRDFMMSILHRKMNSRFIEELKNSKSELGERIEIKGVPR